MLLQIVSIRFQVLFHLSVRDTFHLSLTVLVRYRSLHIFSLSRWSCQIPTEFHVLRSTWDKQYAGNYAFKVRGYHPLWLAFPCHSSIHNNLRWEFSASRLIYPATPHVQRLKAYRHTVWAIPISLTTTLGITFVLYSFSYLDVSVHWVPSSHLNTIARLQVWVIYLQYIGFPHSEIWGSNGYVLLTPAYRSLSRPSSVWSVKASTIRS